MPIPESQLRTWANQGAVVTSQRTYASITNALDKYRWAQGIEWERYLQGSYRNHTNVWDDSDVDVVAQLNSTIQFNWSELSEADQAQIRTTIIPPTYTWAEFRSDVLVALRSQFGVGSVRERNKGFEVLQGSGRRSAHVIPSLQLRYYKALDKYIIGIQLWTRDGKEIRNYPKQHIDNGASKNTQTSEWYKPTIRMFKNIRTFLVDSKATPDGLVSSYFIECLLWNVPNANFGKSYQDTFCNVVNYLGSAQFDGFLCQNDIQHLFGNSPWQWSQVFARTFHSNLVALWKNWR